MLEGKRQHKALPEVQGGENREQGPDATAFRLFSRVSDTWEAVLNDCAAASRFIDFEQYILGHDVIGRRLLELFTRKAREGVRVRVLCDAIGSSDLMASDACEPLREAGGEVLFYNALTASSFLHLPPRVHRDHRKAVIIDDRVSYIGGVCFEDRMRDWRDTMVRFEGPPPYLMGFFFESTWRRAKIDKGKRVKILPPAERGMTRDRPYRYLVNSPEPPIDRELYDCLRERLNGARRSIRLTTPYFIPEHAFVRLLRRAQKRGVEITLLLPGICDHPIADIFSRSFAQRLARHGCRVGFYKDQMIHAKVAIVDGTWAMVSSLNLDRLSFRLNLENGVASEEPEFVRALNAQFDEDLANCRPEPPELPGLYPYVEPILRPLGHIF